MRVCSVYPDELLIRLLLILVCRFGVITLGWQLHASGIFLSGKVGPSPTRALSPAEHFQSAASDRIAGASPVGLDEQAAHRTDHPELSGAAVFTRRQILFTHPPRPAGHRIPTNRRPRPPWSSHLRHGSRRMVYGRVQTSIHINTSSDLRGFLHENRERIIAERKRGLTMIGKSICCFVFVIRVFGFREIFF